jgi:hypothetical protein
VAGLDGLDMQGMCGADILDCFHGGYSLSV